MFKSLRLVLALFLSALALPLIVSSSASARLKPFSSTPGWKVIAPISRLINSTSKWVMLVCVARLVLNRIF